MNKAFKYDRDSIISALNDYIDNTDDPMLQEFCSQSSSMPCRDTIYEWAKENKFLSDTLKRLQTKQECFLARAKDINPVMAIFRLKQPQHGYTDKQEVKHDVNSTIVVKVLDDIDEE